MLSFEELVAQCDRTRQAMLPLPTEAVEAFQEWGYWQMPHLPVKPEPTPEQRFEALVEQCKEQRRLLSGKPTEYAYRRLMLASEANRTQTFVDDAALVAEQIRAGITPPHYLIASLAIYRQEHRM